MLDTLRHIETPEGVELNLRTAGIYPRAGAWLLDTLIRLGVYLLLALVIALLGQFALGLLLLCLFLGEWFYPVFFEVLRNGATPGKRAFGLAVVHDDGTPVSVGSSVIRNLLRAVDFFPLAYGLGLCTMAVQRDFKRLGDLVAGTVVVYRDEAPRRQKPPPADAFVPLSTMTQAEQQAIVDFADRGRAWSRPRLCELADLCEPLTGVRGEDGVRRLLGIARWLGEER